LSNPVRWQNWMAAYLGYTLRMRTLFRGWPIIVNDMHTRRRRSRSVQSTPFCQLSTLSVQNVGLHSQTVKIWNFACKFTRERQTTCTYKFTHERQTACTELSCLQTLWQHLIIFVVLYFSVSSRSAYVVSYLVQLWLWLWLFYEFSTFMHIYREHLCF